MTTQHQTDALLIANHVLQGDYHQLDLHAPAIAADARPGQFVHVHIPNMEHRILRRPFSIYDTDAATGRVSVIYKVVGEGTRQLADTTAAGTPINVLGPLGKPFTMPEDGSTPVVVAGGYGCAATYLLAKNAPRKPIVLLGGRSQGDILLKREYEALGCEVRIATNDGSCGACGFVTALLKDVLQSEGHCFVAACGPNPMLKAVSELTLPAGAQTQVSLDQPMCCGIGACFACVIKVKDRSSADGWRYSRSCLEGPVYDANDVYWD